MASLGNLQLSLLHGEQKTIFSAANFNIDFTLIKLPPPTEYQGLGHCLTHIRKKEAEDGALHAVARKLGALFAGEVPDVPNLIRAYGERATNISQNQKANPKGSKAFGVFSEHIGADGTSLWAAATSGKSAITMHLLACMLARIWPSAEAISLWSELVAVRKSQLQSKTRETEFEIPDLVNARIEIAREQLAAWDNSAR
jgi:hypothetical protein